MPFGRSEEGRRLVARRIGDPGAERTALIVGETHGDEEAGRAVIRRLRSHPGRLRAVDAWTVASINPDGHAAGTAHERQRRRPEPELPGRLEGRRAAGQRLLPRHRAVQRERVASPAPARPAHRPGRDDPLPPALGRGARPVPRTDPVPARSTRGSRGSRWTAAAASACPARRPAGRTGAAAPRSWSSCPKAGSATPACAGTRGPPRRSAPAGLGGELRRPASRKSPPTPGPRALSWSRASAGRGAPAISREAIREGGRVPRGARVLALRTRPRSHVTPPPDEAAPKLRSGADRDDRGGRLPARLARHQPRKVHRCRDPGRRDRPRLPRGRREQPARAAGGAGDRRDRRRVRGRAVRPRRGGGRRPSRCSP